MDWELIAKVFAGLCVVLVGYIYISNQNRTETRLDELTKQVQELSAKKKA